MTMNKEFLKLLAATLLLIFTGGSLFARHVDFTGCKIYYPAVSSEKTILAAQMLHDEIARKTGVYLQMDADPEFFGASTIIVGLENEILSLHKNFESGLKELPATRLDGYKILSLPDEKIILIAGHDNRGVMYGVGYLLRKMELRNEDIKVPLLSVSSSPKFQIRGHHISYYFTNDSLLKVKSLFEQYLRELIYFGLNHVSVSNPAEAKLAMEYGMDISVYMANVGGDFESPEGIRKELEKRDNIQKYAKIERSFCSWWRPG